MTICIFIFIFYLSSATLGNTQMSKSKLVIAPVLSPLAQTSTTASSGNSTQSSKHVTNLLLPVNIPQQTVSNKSNLFNVKINNGQINPDNKGTITGSLIRNYIS